MYPRIKRIFMAWRAGKSHSRIIVGEIKSNASMTRFKYIKDGVEKAREEGFVGYPDFPEIGKTYDTNVLRILSQRLNDSERSDINHYYEFWEIPQNSVKDIYRLLAYTGGILPTDNFEFLADFYGTKNISLVTELTGLSTHQISNDELNEGDKLVWKLEPNNLYDKFAVSIYKNDKLLGYIKKIHSHLFYKKGGYFLSVRVKRIEHNGHINKVFLLISSDKY